MGIPEGRGEENGLCSIVGCLTSCPHSEESTCPSVGQEQQQGQPEHCGHRAPAGRGEAEAAGGARDKDCRAVLGARGQTLAPLRKGSGGSLPRSALHPGTRPQGGRADVAGECGGGGKAEPKSSGDRPEICGFP